MKPYKLFTSLILFFLIVFYGIVKINIQWTADMINSETPYKSEAIEVLKKDNINANKYAIDRTALKIYYSKYSGNNIRIDFWDYVFLWSEEAIEDLKNNIKNGYKEANDNAGLLIKSSMNRLKGILP